MIAHNICAENSYFSSIGAHLPFLFPNAQFLFFSFLSRSFCTSASWHTTQRKTDSTSIMSTSRKEEEKKNVATNVNSIENQIPSKDKRRTNILYISFCSKCNKLSILYDALYGGLALSVSVSEINGWTYFLRKIESFRWHINTILLRCGWKMGRWQKKCAKKST